MSWVYRAILALLFVSSAKAQTYSGRVIYGGITVSGTQPVTVSDCVVIPAAGGWGVFSDVTGANITMRNVLVIGNGAHIFGAASVTIQNCNFDCRGGVGIEVQNDGPTSERILIVNNDVIDSATAIQLERIQNDPNISILSNRVTQSASYQHNDQISVYASSGTRERQILIEHNLVVSNPNAPQVPNAAAIVAGDTASFYIAAINNVIINGQVFGLTAYQNGGTSLFSGNTIVGLGAPSGWSEGLAVSDGAQYDNTIAWWDSYYGMLRNGGNGSNYELNRAQITLAYEQQLIAQWNQDMAGQVVGYLTTPAIQLPTSGFPK